MIMSSSGSKIAENYHERVVPFTAGDGRKLNLINVRGDSPSSKGPVILVHGAGVRANIFRGPVETNIVDALVAAGYDVWLENWRASIDFAPNLWTLDQAALYDHPQAVKTVRAETGATQLKAVIHCQGSTSFTMSAMAGLIPEVTTTLKLKYLLPPVKLMTQYLNPHWGVEAPTLSAKLITLLVNLTHHECNNAVCKQVSFTYGSGFPALWSHENLNEETHEWLKEEFAEVPLRFFDQILPCIKHGSLVSVEGFEALPVDFARTGPQTDARFAFFAGENNLCFLPISQIKAYEYFSALQKDYHSLLIAELDKD
jgi:hypothetical protein